MFGTQDAIIKEHSGVATVWLISTLGNKSSYKRISKREIQAVSIPQTCDIIRNPPAPMALRLTSNLLYGVALIYKQKTDYLNNDTAAIKTRVQRDLFHQNSNKNLLLKPNVDFLRALASADGSNLIVQNGQILLNDDPSFNMAGGLLPSLNGLDFLDNIQFTDTEKKLTSKRKVEIREADFAHNVASYIPTSSQAGEEAIFDRRLNQDDELDADNAEFAFDEDGLLFSLHEDFAIHESQPGISAPADDVDINFDFDFDFGDLNPINETNLDMANVGNDEEIPLGQILHEIEPGFIDVEETNTVLQTVVQPVGKKKPRKKRTRTDYHNIAIDESIGLQTEDLRRFRDNYVDLMIAKIDDKKKSKKHKISAADLLEDTQLFIPTFIKIDLETRGRPRIREQELLDQDEDFVDGLMRNRRSSGSIEVGRRASSSTTRRDSRSSISGLNLPLMDNNENDQPLNYDAGGDDYYYLDFGDGNPGIDNTTTEERNKAKRSSSSGAISRFEPVQEDAETRFDFGIVEDLGKVPINENQEKEVEKDLTVEEIENKYGRKTLKFLGYIETRLNEEQSDSILFGTLLEEQTNRSIYVKSFYEILQLATLKQIAIEVHQPDGNRFKILDPLEFAIRLR